MVVDNLKEKNLSVITIISCQNEEKFIGKCLDSIITNNYPKDSLEVLAIDGTSDDKTQGLLEKYAQQPYYMQPRGELYLRNLVSSFTG